MKDGTDQTPHCRATILPTDGKERKGFPVASGVMDYFPDALVAIAEVSQKGNDQHNPGQPLHWDRSKSKDEADTMQRHFLQRGERDTDGMRHSAKMAWRALAILQKEIEAETPVLCGHCFRWSDSLWFRCDKLKGHEGDHRQKHPTIDVTWRDR